MARKKGWVRPIRPENTAYAAAILCKVYHHRRLVPAKGKGVPYRRRQESRATNARLYDIRSTIAAWIVRRITTSVTPAASAESR